MVFDSPRQTPAEFGRYVRFCRLQRSIRCLLKQLRLHDLHYLDMIEIFRLAPDNFSVGIDFALFDDP